MKRSLAAVATAATLLLAIPSPASAVPETQLHLAALERGPDVRVPHLEGHTVVDGDTRIPVRAGRVRLLGTSGEEYVVGTSNSSGAGSFRVLRLAADGARRVVLRDVPVWDMRLSGDGTQLGSARQDRDTRIRVWDSRTGLVETRRLFRGSVTILDFDENRMVLGGWGPDRTFWWNTATDRTRRIASQPGYAAEISADRVATLTADPYQGGCSVVSTLRGHDRVWRSCDERVWRFSPDHGRMATIPLLTDGVGPADVYVHGPGGRLTSHYTSRWFDTVTWETDRALLLEANGARHSATVRCVAQDCERASDLRPVPTL